MNGWISSLISLHVLAHALFGCCWHHGHAPKSMASGEVACCHHDHPHDDFQDEPCVPQGDDDSSGECEGSRCVFAAASTKVCPSIVNVAEAPLPHIATVTGCRLGDDSPSVDALHDRGPPDVPLSGRSQTLRI